MWDPLQAVWCSWMQPLCQKTVTAFIGDSCIGGSHRDIFWGTCSGQDPSYALLTHYNDLYDMLLFCLTLFLWIKLLQTFMPKIRNSPWLGWQSPQEVPLSLAIPYACPHGQRPQSSRQLLLLCGLKLPPTPSAVWLA